MEALLIGFLLYAEVVLMGATGVTAVQKHDLKYGPFPPVEVMAQGFPRQQEENRIARKRFFSEYEKIDGRWVKKAL